MFKFGIFIGVILINLLTAANALEICDDDGQYKDHIKSVTVENCDVQSERCILKKGKNASVEIDFIAKIDSSVVQAVVHGIVFDIPVLFSLDNSNGCENSGIICPVKAGQEYKYSQAIFVEKLYPDIPVDVKWELTNGNETSLACVIIPAKIR